MAMEVEVVEPLGFGSVGDVSLVKLKDPDGDSKYSAMKVCCPRNYASLNREIQILSKLRGCPRVVQSLGDDLQEDLAEDGQKFYGMFLEYAPGGDLYDFMSQHVDRIVPDRMIRKITRMILEGLAFVHGRGYIHCDLKPDNVLCFPGSEVKISDFGSSRTTEDKDDWWKPDCPFWATPPYMSPESVEEGKIGKAHDIWSLGCVVLEMYTREPPWPNEDEEEIIRALRNGDAPEIPETLPWAARKFLETCFARNPEERGNPNCLLAHPFLRGVESYPNTEDQRPLRFKDNI